MEISLNENERLDDLELNGLRIIQNKEYFCFGIDAVLLADFARDMKQNGVVMDLGTGTGIIPLILSAKTNCNKIVGVEIQEGVFNIAKRNVKLNNLENLIDLKNCNIKDLSEIYDMGSIDTIVTNPPYKELGRGVVNETDNKLISRHEVKANLEDFIKVSGYLLKDKGTMYMVHKPERLVDILCLMRKYKVEPKVLRYVFSNVNSEPTLILIKAVKNGKSFLKTEKNLYIYDEIGNYSEEILKIYGKERE